MIIGRRQRRRRVRSRPLTLMAAPPPFADLRSVGELSFLLSEGVLADQLIRLRVLLLQLESKICCSNLISCGNL
jgi:hypothetical protein